MKRRRFLAASVGLLATAAGCIGGPDRELPGSPTGSWHEYAHDPHNTASSDVTVPPRGTPAWDSGEAHVAGPVLEDGRLYSVANDASAVDARTGEQKWEAGLEASAEHAPALVGDRLVVATEDRLVALDREDGSELWARSIPSFADGPVTVGDEASAVLVPVADTGLVAHEADTGDRLWTHSMPQANPPAVDGDDVYVTGFGGEGDTAVLRALSAADGGRRWERKLDAPDAAPVVVAEGVLVGDDGTLAVHAAEDGRRRRTVATFDGGLESQPAVDDGTAYVASEDGQVVAVSLAEGTVEWRVDVTVLTQLAVGENAVVVPVEDLPEAGRPGVVALERSDGTVRWEHGIEGFDAVVSTPPVLADGAVFYASNESVGIVALGDLAPRTDE